MQILHLEKRLEKILHLMLNQFQNFLTLQENVAGFEATIWTG